MSRHSDPLEECPNCGRTFNSSVNRGQCPACGTEGEQSRRN